MSPRSRAALLVLLLLAGTLGAAGADPPSSPSPGERGYMLTALRGERVERIPVEFIGTVRDAAGPGYDVHLVQLEGPLAERVGVASGMSGSPVFINEELIGALAFRMGTMPKQPVAGVTPIEDMRAAYRPRDAVASAGFGRATPIATPIAAGGLTAELAAWAGPWLEELGFVMVGGGGLGSDPSARSELRPGGPVGVELVRGDLSLAATGTVTWIEDDRVYAFGHPFLGSGPVEIPMVSAQVVHTLADLAGSFKMTNIGTELGAFIEDRLSGMVGRKGIRARMIPLQMTVRRGDLPAQTFEFELARNARLLPVLTATAVANSLVRNVARETEATMRLAGRIRLGDLPDLPLEMSFAGQEPAVGVAAALRGTLAELTQNPFAELEMEGIEFEIDVRPEIVRYRLEGLRYDRGGVRPGETIEVGCLLRRYRGDTEVRKLAVAIPEGLPEGTELRLLVGPPSQVDRGLGHPDSGRLQSADDLASLVRALGDRRSDHRLVAVLAEAARGVVSRGRFYESLPPTAERLLSAGARGTSRRVTPLARLTTAEMELDGPVDGGLLVRLRVDSGSPKKGPAR